MTRGKTNSKKGKNYYNRKEELHPIHSITGLEGKDMKKQIQTFIVQKFEKNEHELESSLLSS